MDINDTFGKSSPESWSTCDLSTNAECLIIYKAQSSRLESKMNKKILAKQIFAWAVSQISVLRNRNSLKNAVKELLHEDLEFLKENFGFNCCIKKRHSSACYKKLKKIEKIVVSLIDESFEEEKPIFKITKREKPSKALLLDNSQPFWVHRILVQNFFLSSHKKVNIS